VVAAGIERLRTPDRSFMVITHYPRLLEHVRPDRVHVLQDGRIVRSGGAELAAELERDGYGPSLLQPVAT
jgi:Fe-S cluster assembly ATP-binding protein